MPRLLIALAVSVLTAGVSFSETFHAKILKVEGAKVTYQKIVLGKPASIYEPATNKYWYNFQADKYFVPASNTKLPTCYAAMKYLGDSLIPTKKELFT